MTNSETGICHACSQINMRTDNFCSFCGFKLPWADSVDLLAAGVSSAGSNEVWSSPIKFPPPQPLPNPLQTAAARQTEMKPEPAGPQFAVRARSTSAAPLQGLVQTHRKAEAWGAAIMVLGAFITGDCARIFDASATADPARQEALRGIGRALMDAKVDGIVVGLAVFFIGGVTYYCAKWSPPRMVPPAEKKTFAHDVVVKTLSIFIVWGLIIIFDRR